MIAGACWAVGRFVGDPLPWWMSVRPEFEVLDSVVVLDAVLVVDALIICQGAP